MTSQATGLWNLRAYGVTGCRAVGSPEGMKMVDVCAAQSFAGGEWNDAPAAGDMQAVSRGALTQEPEVRVVREQSEWESLRGEWATLFDSSPTASPPLHFDWLTGWWRIYGPAYGSAGNGLAVILVRRGSRLIGALPLYQSVIGGPFLGRRRLGFLSSGE